MSKRFIEFLNDEKIIRFIIQYDYELRDGIGST